MNITPHFTIEDDNIDLLRQFTAYIREVVRYAKLEYSRKQKYRVHEVPLENASDEAVAHEDPLPMENGDFGFTDEKLSGAYSDLKSLQKKILVHIFVEELSAQETAEKLDCSVDYVYLQKHRILKKLRDQLMEEGDTHGK